MSDQKSKKPKIDLKARLGKSTPAGPSVPVPLPGVPAATDGGTVPPPPAGISRPSVTGIAPPGGISPGIPLPPFAPSLRPQRPEPAKPQQPQTIKVEVGEEIVQERKAHKKHKMLALAAGAVLGGVIGFAWGGGAARGAVHRQAIAGAGALAKEITDSNEKIKELDGKIQSAFEKLGQGQFPDALANDLGGINIPFEAQNLENKQIGSLKAVVQRMLFSYTIDATSLNDSKDRLKGLLVISQKPIEKIFTERKEPNVNYSVVFFSGRHGVMAELVPNKEPFPLGKEWPEKYKVMRTTQKNPEAQATRWKKGDLTGSDLVAVPVEEKTVAAFSADILPKLQLELTKVRELINGRKSPIPEQETPGLLKTGDDLVHELKKIVRAGE